VPDDAAGGKFETGTPPFELLAGLIATVEHFAWLGELAGETGSRRARIVAGYGLVEAHEVALGSRLIKGLAALPGVTLIGPPSLEQGGRRVPTVSFRHERVKPAEIAAALAEENIFVWSGHNYALETVRQLGIPEHEGVVRIGAAHYNTVAEIDQALTTVARVIAGG
jgi:selenocysteine lyase/cysteine desulfurase